MGEHIKAKLSKHNYFVIGWIGTLFVGLRQDSERGLYMEEWAINGVMKKWEEVRPDNEGLTHHGKNVRQHSVSDQNLF